MSITLRNIKGSELTFNEVDNNFKSYFHTASLDGNILKLTYFTPPNNISQEIDLTSIAGGNTGSFFIDASVDKNVITFTRGDGTPLSITVDTGSGGGTEVIANPGGTGPSLDTIKIDGNTFEISGSGGIEYVNDNENITSIEVLDYTTDVEAIFNNGALKFIFGNPSPPNAILSINGFNQNRFNKQLDNYDVVGTFGLGGYTLISASLFETTSGNEVLIAGPVDTGNNFNLNFITSGSRSYKLEVTSSNPATGQIVEQSRTDAENLNKTPPGLPTVNPVATNVLLGSAGNKIEIGSTGTLTFTPIAGASNGWDIVLGSLTSNVSSPITLTTSDKNNISIFASADYVSPPGAANPAESIARVQSPVTSFSRIRSLRFGTALRASWTETDLEDLPLWDTTLGGSVGTIYKGTINPNNQQISTTFAGVLYLYIVYDKNQNDLTEILGSVGNEFGLFTKQPDVGQYKVYRSTNQFSGGTGATYNYTLKT